MRRSGIGREGGSVTRLRRRLGLERSGLRRRVDRVQRVVGFGLLVLLLAVAPPLAAWAAASSYEAGVRAADAERAERRQVVATVTAADAASGSDAGYIHETVQATWPGAGGEPRAGTLPSWQDARVGAQRQIWVDRSGDPVAPPRPHSRTVTDSVYAGTAAVLGTGLPLLLLYLLVRRRCDRYRSALWEAAWVRMDRDANPRS